MDSVMQVLSHEYTGEREEHSEAATEVGSTALQDVLAVLSVHFASTLVGIVIAAIALP